MTTSSGHPNEQAASLTFPQVSLQSALEGAFRLYSGAPGNRTFGDAQVKTLLGSSRTTGDSARLMVGMNIYGLIDRHRAAYTLTSRALSILSADDHTLFRIKIHEAAMLPEGVLEVFSRYGIKSDSSELDQELKSRSIGDGDRKTIKRVLQENTDFVHQEELSRDLYGRIRASAMRKAKLFTLAWFEEAGGWLRSRAGRGATLITLALLLVTSLAAVALHPFDRAATPVVRQVGGAVPGIGVPAVREPVVTPAVTVPVVTVTVPLPKQVMPVQARAAARNTISPNPPGDTSSAPHTATRVPADTESRAAPPALPPVVQQTLTAQPENPLTRGRELTNLLYTERLPQLWAAFGSGVRQEWGDLSAFQSYRKAGLSTFGAESRLISEQVRQNRGVTYYARTATFERGPRTPWTLIIGLSETGQVVAFNIVAAKVLPGMAATSVQ